MAIFDISPLVSDQTAVFPGDTPFQAEFLMSFSGGNHLELSRITSTPHIGAHADSSSHYHAKGKGISDRPLRPYLGRAQVIEVEAQKDRRIQVADLKESVITEKRVLFKTLSFPDPNKWNDDFMSLSPELIHYLADRGVVLVGIDTPSVDPMTSKSLESHQALYQTEMCVLEGLDLQKIQPGSYYLVALPLAIQGLDASPVRAILCETIEDLTGVD